MAKEDTRLTELLSEATAQPWFALWKCAAIWGQATLEGIACFYGLQSVRSARCTGSLATLALAMDRQMRTPAFLGLLPFGLRMLGARGPDFHDSVLRLLAYLFPIRPSAGDYPHDRDSR
jgi:hypothetical protein